MNFPILTADEAAALIHDGERLGVSGFTAAGSLKLIPAALARKAEAEHAAGRPFKVDVMSGASTNELLDGVLSDAQAINRRMPYQSSGTMRKHINKGEIQYCDTHLSLMPQFMRYGFLPTIDTAIIEVADVTDEGEITLTTGLGNSPTFCLMAERIILELNTYHKPELRKMHDIFIPEDPPYRESIGVLTPESRIGTRTLKVDPEKIVGIVKNHMPDGIGGFKAGTPETDRIGENVVAFLEKEYQEGRLPAEFLPVQSGVGNVANAVLAKLGESELIPPFKMYTEVVQDSVIELMKQGRCLFASGCSLTVSDEVLQEIYENFDFFRDKIILRPQEISNNPAIGRRLGLICMNTAIEADIFGNVNSTHLFGANIMNGLGGSGDFARCAALTIFTCPSVARNGSISAIVPMVSHTDHTEHDVSVIITDQGVADLRGKSPRERAELIIENCAHPDYRPLLRSYLELTPGAHTPHCLRKAFCFHTAYQDTGDMRNAEI